MTVVIDRAVVSIVPATAAAVRELVRRCSPESVRRRFFLPAALDPDEAFARYRRYLLAGPPSGVAALATVGDVPVGLLNLVVVGDGLVEASLLVADAWQRRGVATHLLDSELGRERWAGWTVRASVQPDNRAIRRLLRTPRWGARRVVGADPAQLDIEIVRPGARDGAEDSAHG
jgi:GNAT superfamily N-acetyltransferase